METRWKNVSPPCSRCRSYFPTVDGWRCFTAAGHITDAVPEEIEDTEGGNCGTFAYRSTILDEENQWDDVTA